MAAAKALISLEYSTFRAFSFIPQTKYSFSLTKSRIKVLNGDRFISLGSCIGKNSNESNNTNGNTSRTGIATKKKYENENRTDLERFKELLLQKKPDAAKSDIIKDESIDRTKPAIFKTESAVDVSRITDILSSLRTRQEHTSKKTKEKSARPRLWVETEQLKYTSSTRHEDHSDNGTVERKVKSRKPSVDQMVKTKKKPSVDAHKFKDVLSALGQDSSSAEEVLMTGRPISSDQRLAIDGTYIIKQRQYEDKDQRKKMTLSSLRTGPRSHMFDDVREKWPQKHHTEDKSIFEEMAEQEMRDLGMSATVQSGFHDLIENVHRQWPFPIDNEVCKGEENVSFDEHVFLEDHLADFPKTGNVQQFMELVVTGLQQNPHLSVEEKKEHVEWFKEYFRNIPDEQVQL